MSRPYHRHRDEICAPDGAG